MLNTAKNIAVSALNPKKAEVMAKKIMIRLMGDRGSLSSEENQKWLEKNAKSCADWLSHLDPVLWEEAEQKAKDYVQHDVERIRGKYPQEIHGPGGAYAMLYFLIRKLRPEYVVETGVSLGCSSHAILSALKANAHGTLYSSDFPYFRIKDAERYIGFVVPESLRDRWHLFLDGDAKNLPAILNQIPRVDFFHYDSDKSIAGRNLAYRLLSPKMAPGAPMLFDDINDNAHFYDLLQKQRLQEKAKIIEYRGKYIGTLNAP